MIIRETDTHYIFIDQHQHGILSGIFAYHINPSLVQNPDELALASSLHDSGWIDFDQQCLWNDEKNRPYDFIDLPNHLRLPMYIKSLNDLERVFPYSALLTSMHYCSFFTEGVEKDVDAFLEHEKKRQHRLLQAYHPDIVFHDFIYFQFFDHLSLYVCLNHPGVQKAKEHPWYKNGIPLLKKPKQTILASWLNERTIMIDPFIFEQPFHTTLLYSKCRKSLGKKDPDRKKIYKMPLTFISNSKRRDH